MNAWYRVLSTTLISAMAPPSHSRGQQGITEEPKQQSRTLCLRIGTPSGPCLSPDSQRTGSSSGISKGLEKGRVTLAGSSDAWPHPINLLCELGGSYLSSPGASLLPTCSPGSCWLLGRTGSIGLYGPGSAHLPPPLPLSPAPTLGHTVDNERWPWCCGALPRCSWPCAGVVGVSDRRAWRIMRLWSMVSRKLVSWVGSMTILILEPFHLQGRGWGVRAQCLICTHRSGPSLQGVGGKAELNRPAVLSLSNLGGDPEAGPLQARHCAGHCRTQWLRRPPTSWQPWEGTSAQPVSSAIS